MLLLACAAWALLMVGWVFFGCGFLKALTDAAAQIERKNDLDGDMVARLVGFTLIMSSLTLGLWLILVFATHVAWRAAVQ